VTARAQSGRDRVKAHRIRSKQERGEELTTDEEAFLENYPEDPHAPAPANASASEKITYTEERAAAQGDHPHPDAYAAVATAEGLRADTLLKIASQAMIQCMEQHRIMSGILLDRTIAIENAHVQMLDVIREERMARIEAEGEARIAELANEVGGGDQELTEMIKLIGMAIQNRDPKAIAKAKQKRKKSKNSRPLGSIG
jgi:hypothetical protein